jgi:hypothetical protein
VRAEFLSLVAYRHRFSEGILSMAKNEKTSKSAASKAAKILANPKSSKAAKSVAGSALTQAPDNKSKKK